MRWAGVMVGQGGGGVEFVTVFCHMNILEHSVCLDGVPDVRFRLFGQVDRLCVASALK